MRIIPFALLASILLLNHPGLAQTKPGPAPSQSAPITPAPAGPGTSSQAMDGKAAAAAPPTREIMVSSLTDKDLRGQDNSDLGDIERVVESTADKKPYVVVSNGGFLGFFEKEYLVPVDQLTVSGDTVTAKNTTQAQLESATPFVDDPQTYRVLDASQKISVSVPTPR
jgi:hypothetical protein